MRAALFEYFLVEREVAPKSVSLVLVGDSKIDCETIRDTRRPVEALAKRVEITIADTDIGRGSLAWIACHDLNDAARGISAEERPLGTFQDFKDRKSTRLNSSH